MVLKANRVFKYTINPDKDGGINFSPNRLMGAAEPGETWTFRLYVMTNDGKYVETTLDVTKPAEEATPAPAETEAPAETPAGSPEATEEPAAPATTEGSGSGSIVVIVIVAIVVLLAAAYLIFRKKKNS